MGANLHPQRQQCLLVGALAACCGWFVYQVVHDEHALRLAPGAASVLHSWYPEVPSMRHKCARPPPTHTHNTAMACRVRVGSLSRLWRQACTESTRALSSHPSASRCHGCSMSLSQRILQHAMKSHASNSGRPTWFQERPPVPTGVSQMCWGCWCFARELGSVVGWYHDLIRFSGLSLVPNQSSLCCAVTVCQRPFWSHAVMHSRPAAVLYAVSCAPSTGCWQPALCASLSPSGVS